MFLDNGFCQVSFDCYSAHKNNILHRNERFVFYKSGTNYIIVRMYRHSEDNRVSTAIYSEKL